MMPSLSTEENRMYNKMWHQTQEALSALLDKEPQKMIEPQRNQVFIFQTLATFYIKYVQIFRNLENVYDQIVHPQKRILIRKVLDGVMGRILELKNEMVELELTEFHYFDDILQDLKLAPQQLDIPIPKYFLKEKLEVIKGREKILAQILADSGIDTSDMKYPVKGIPFDEAVKLIQVAERARQGRLRALFMKQIYLQEYRAKQSKMLGKKVTDTWAAALRIQKVWRRFHQYKETEKLREEEMIFLGMNPPPLFNEVSATVIQAEKVDCLRNEVQIKHEEDYREALVTIKNDLKLIEGLDIKENLQDQIRHWFIECRNLTGTFPDYPDIEEGGSAIIFSNKTIQQVIEDIIANQEEEEKNEKKKKKKKEKQPKKAKKQKKGTKEKNKEEDEKWKMSPSLFLPAMKEGCNAYRGTGRSPAVIQAQESINSSTVQSSHYQKHLFTCIFLQQTFSISRVSGAVLARRYKEIWMKKDESWNFSQDYDPELIREEKRKELESEIRIQVDELMRQELKNLKLAVDRERERPVKAGKKKDKKKGKKGKKKEKKAKKDKDLTADRTIESLYKELVEEGLLIQALKVNLSDYIGDYSYLGTTLRQVSIEPMPSLLDVRQLITLYGIWPLGSAAVHEKAPLVKSLLLAGPSGVGKKMLVHAICTETGANLFNLSSSNIAGKYPGKNGLQMMLHAVFKNEPKRLKKHLPQILKLLKPDDRILIVGTTRRPFDAELQSFCKVYQKIILVPRPDYASRYVLWKQIIERNGGVLTSALNVSCLAKVTDGFTQGHIVEVVKGVLTDQRIRRQIHKPLTAVEFIMAIASMNPVYKEEEESFKNWYAKTPLGKKRALAITGGSTEKAKDKGKRKEKKEKKATKKK
ncbi:dynein regulatory complex protein 11 isoform X3 [Hylobates moloch]|uniref:dynein regulatory complex protein 11 isoform X3 n=1 Tax=Hylobates moloch TaxID=81572 RepID=UPI0013F284E2|nr:dynein regulatory complex protein 11 isoform X3 [Hylobates moloch]